MLAPDLVLPNLIARRAAAFPDRVFLQHVDGSQMTYRQLHEKALRWAGGLARLGVKRGDTVLVMLPNGFDAIVAWLAISHSGAMEVPVNTGYRGRILEYIINNSTAKVMITCTQFLERVDFVADGIEGDATSTGLALLEQVLVTDHAAPPRGRLKSVQSAAATLDDAVPVTAGDLAHHDIATIVYTSGTTGPSKGVMMPWAQCHAMSTGCIPLDDMGMDDAWYSPFPLFHMSGKLAVYASALFNGRVVLREAFSTRDFWPEVRKYGCTASLLIGTTMTFVASQPPSPEDRNHPLRNVLMAPMPADPEAFMRRFGVRICQVFNMTEISCPIWTRWELKGKSCGRLREGYEVRIVDARDEAVPVGEVGEIIVRASQPWLLNAGYYRMPEKTVEAWRNGWFHTGDAGYVDAEGWYYFVDRKKDAIRRRGENISSMELEAMVCACPGVQEAAAVGVPSELGEDEVKVAITVRPGSDFTPQKLIEYLIPRVPRFMVPRYVEVMAALPKTPTEKVRKQELRDAGVTAATWDREKAGVIVPR
ncbi:MAG: AMP-binding protein [Betaproteobacteria bacterium]|nr:AMP-binding protein [Betaproteobacteria bacterium]